MARTVSYWLAHSFGLLRSCWLLLRKGALGGILLLITGGVLLVGCAGREGFSQPENKQKNQVSNADAQLDSIAQAYWQLLLEENPLFAMVAGEEPGESLLPDFSLAARPKAHAQRARLLERLGEINETRLSASGRLNYAVLQQVLTDSKALLAQPLASYMVVTNRDGPHIALASIPTSMPFYTKADYRRYARLLAQIPQAMAQAQARLAEAARLGYTQPCLSMRGYGATISVHIVNTAQESVFYAPFAAEKPPGTIGNEQWNRWRSEAAATIMREIVPAFARYFAVYDTSYAPACRKTSSIAALSGGEAYYEALVRHHTTLPSITAREIHEIGLQEVVRIRARMRQLLDEAGIDQPLDSFIAAMRTDPRFVAESPEALMQYTALVAKRIDGALPLFFSQMPVMPFTLKQVPADTAEKTTTAYYQPPAGDGRQAGTYWVNTSLLKTRPLYEVPALSLHEASPGHHFQIALAQELPLPSFRRFYLPTAYIEGWALYAEHLGVEMGIYRDVYDHMGRLSYEMWRACRLVVDTGLHAQDMTRQQAIDFMAQNTALSIHNITTEVDRYITWPGQALGYKIGELQIKAHRRAAEEALGADFDLRDFHREVLRHGALPLSVFDDVMAAWLEQRKHSHIAGDVRAAR